MLAVHVDQPSTAPDHQMALLMSVVVDHQMAQLFEQQDADALVFAVDHQMLVSVVVNRQPTMTVQPPRVDATFRSV